MKDTKDLPLFFGADMEEWRQCGRWLIDCKVLPPNHRVVWPSAAVFDLAQALRDGVLLCQMLHNLSPGSVDLKEINFRPQMSQVSLAPSVIMSYTCVPVFFSSYTSTASEMLNVFMFLSFAWML